MLTRRSMLLGLAAGATTVALPLPAAKPQRLSDWASYDNWAEYYRLARGKLLATLTPDSLIGLYVLVLDPKHQPIGLLQRLDVYEHGLVGERLVGFAEGPNHYRTFSGELHEMDGSVLRVGGDLREITDRMAVRPFHVGSDEHAFVVQILDERELDTFTLRLDDETFDFDELVRRCPVAEVLVQHSRYRSLEQLQG